MDVAEAAEGADGERAAEGPREMGASREHRPSRLLLTSSTEDAGSERVVK